ncbi:MAG: hypothetical protein QXS00_05595 [Pyrobaculum sp.]|uniref:hypothetical protein n=1 Tax=Pyrobaculum sp. TaxID=2004705 RepID=UPI003173AF93
MRLDYGRASASPAFTDDEKLKGRYGAVMPYAKHLLALSRFMGKGWDLLWWYAEAMSGF